MRNLIKGTAVLMFLIFGFGTGSGLSYVAFSMAGEGDGRAIPAVASAMIFVALGVAGIRTTIRAKM